MEYQYDACSCSPNGRQTKVSNPYLSGETPLWATTEYDAPGRVTRVTAPDGSATTTSYAGNTTTVTDPAGKRKKFTYDAFGNMTQVAEPDAQGNLTVLTNYTYDTQSRLLTVSMNGGTQTRHFVYNQYGQVTSATNPENGTVSYTYNNDGTLASKSDAKNQTMLFQYDTWKRVTRIYGSGSSYEKRFYYDGYPSDPGEHTTGRLAAMEWEMPGPPPYTWQTHYWRHVFGYTTYGAVTGSKLVDRYDASGYGDYTEEVTAADFAWTMQGEPSFVGYPSGRQLYYSFDSAGRGSGLVASAAWDEYPNPNSMKSLVTGTAFNKAGQMTSLTAYGGTETRAYDTNTLQLTAIQVPGSLDLGYVYPAAGTNNGRISAETNNLTNTQVSYTYDQLNRLATAVSTTGGNTNWGLGFSYDVYGNRTGQTVTAGSAPAFSATFGSNNRMVGYSYDNNGNQLNTADGATLEYDEENRLKKWTKQGQTQEYTYHPSGWRLSNSNDGGYFYGPGGQLLTKSATRCTDYVYFAGRLLYTMSEGSLDPNRTKLTRIYSDRLGSTRATAVLTYGGGTTTRNYYPFGEEIGSTANNEYKFASTYRDSATGLDYAINRYYASGMGRFLSADPYQASGGPADPQSWNRYAYVQNDPANFIDPKGMYLCVPGVTCALEMAGSGAGNDGMGVVNEGDASPKEGSGVGHDPVRSECDRSDPTNKRALDFIDAHRADAAKIGAAAGISAQFALAVAAEETLWGTRGIIMPPGNTNNFFGLHVNSKDDIHHFAGQTDVYVTEKDGPVAVFSSASGFLDSGMGFAKNMKGRVKGMTDPAQFAAFLHHHGYGTTNSGYEEELQGVIAGVSKRWDCPK